LPDAGVHIVSCLQQPAPTPQKVADNLWYHVADVSEICRMRTLYQGCIRAARKELREIKSDIIHG
jgi:hypothetical protein